jgi:DNA primase
VIPQAFIQELLARIDIVDVVGQHVKLRKAGTNLLGLCPFHGEKSPSFTVSPSKQFYHCFGCGAHGSAIGFLMEHAGLSYVEAIGDLARSLGLVVPQERGTGVAASVEPDLPRLMQAACDFYRQRLRESPRAIDYLKGRGLTGATAARYAVGYAPDGWRSLQAAVPDYDAPAMLSAGLVIDADGESAGEATGPDSGSVAVARRRYDRFRDRIMFPIRNPRGQVIGFGGRVLGQGEPKYLNSPETPLFSKGRELYGLFEAREAIRAADCAIVVEGYMDVVMLAQHGVGNAVATLGTATTGEHVRKLLRSADRVVFAFDGDAAGRKAAWRALEACLPHALDDKRLEFLFLPAEHDPDSFVRERGAEGFAAQLATTVPLSELLVRELGSQVDLAEPEGRARLLALARPLLLALPREALRLQLVHRIAALGQISALEFEGFLAAGDGNSRGGSGRAPRESWEPAGGRSGGRGAGAQAPGGWPSRGRGGPGGGGSGAGPQAGGWRGRDAPPRVPAAPPDLARRLRLLVALHPALAAQVGDHAFLPSDLSLWLDALAELPAGSAFAAVCETMRERDPHRVAELEADALADPQGLAEMRLEEAQAEFRGALAQLRDRGMRAELESLAASGLAGEAQRARYQELMLAIRAKDS